MDKKKIIILVLIIGAAAALYFYSVGSKGEEGSAEDKKPRNPDIPTDGPAKEEKPKAKSIKELADQYRDGKYIQSATPKDIRGYYFYNPAENPFINPIILPGFIFGRLLKKKKK